MKSTKPIDLNNTLDYNLKDRLYVPLLKAKQVLILDLDYLIDKEIRAIYRKKLTGNIGDKVCDHMRYQIRTLNETI